MREKSADTQKRARLANRKPVRTPGACISERERLPESDPRRFASSKHAAARSTNPMDHIGLCLAMANRMAAYRGEPKHGDEWQSLCWEWLLKCCEKFDPARNVNFSTYYVRACWRNSVKYRDGGGQKRRMKTEDMGDGRRVGRYLWEKHRSISCKDGNDMPVRDTRGGSHGPLQAAIENEERQRDRDRVRVYLQDVLDDEQRGIAMDRARGHTLDQVGKRLGLSRERIRQRCNEIGFYLQPKVEQQKARMARAALHEPSVLMV